jgi:hypothetical protein
MESALAGFGRHVPPPLTGEERICYVSGSVREDEERGDGEEEGFEGQACEEDENEGGEGWISGYGWHFRSLSILFWAREYLSQTINVF